MRELCGLDVLKSRQGPIAARLGAVAPSIPKHPCNVAQTAGTLENDVVRPRRGDYSMTFEFRNFAGDRLNREAQMIGDVKATERDFDGHRGRRV